MLSKLAKFMRVIDTAAAGGRHCSTSSPLKQLAKDAQSGSTSRVFSKIQMPVEPPRQAPNGGKEPKSSWSSALAVVGNVLFFGGIGVAGYFGYYTYMYDVDELRKVVEERKAAPIPLSGAWCTVMENYLEKRIYLNGEIDRFSKPRQDNLLPDQMHPQRKTLVLDLDELLVHSDWTRERGWKVLKRPGLETFIKEMLPYFEVVVYSDQLFTYVEPVMDRVDPERMIYRLHRTDTLYVNGKHVRDLSRLGREMPKVLMISAKPDAWANHPENTLKLEPWKGDIKDTMLFDLIPFLKFTAQRIGLDTRKLVEAYDGKDIPNTFKARMQELETQQQRANSSRGFLGSYIQR